MAGFDLRKLFGWSSDGGGGNAKPRRRDTAPLRQRLQYLLDHQRDAVKTLQEHMERVWHRRLSADESNTLHSYAVCTPTLRLEQAQMRMAHAETDADADSFLADMREQLAGSMDATVAELRRRFVLDEGHAPEPSACANLMAWEEQVLQGL